MNVAVFRSAQILIAGAVLAAPATVFGQDDSDSFRTSWSSPWTITAKSPADKVFVSLGESYGSLSGRTFQLSEALIGFTPTDGLTLWFAPQNYFLKGHTSGRLHLVSNDYGVRYVIKKPTATDAKSWAIQYEGVSPSTADVTTSSSSATYLSTQNNIVSGDYSDGDGFSAQALYGNVRGHSSGNANVFGLGAAGEWAAANATLRVQGQLVGQSWSGADTGTRVNLEVKPILEGTVAYRFLPWASLEGGITFFPSGVPFVSGETTGLSSFLLYEPGGPAADLRHDRFGYGTLRLLIGRKF